MTAVVEKAPGTGAVFCMIVSSYISSATVSYKSGISSYMSSGCSGWLDVGCSCTVSEVFGGIGYRSRLAGDGCLSNTWYGSIGDSGRDDSGDGGRWTGDNCVGKLDGAGRWGGGSCVCIVGGAGGGCIGGKFGNCGGIWVRGCGDISRCLLLTNGDVGTKLVCGGA